jgi:hypothetical protein
MRLHFDYFRPENIVHQTIKMRIANAANASKNKIHIQEGL